MPRRIITRSQAKTLSSKPCLTPPAKADTVQPRSRIGTKTKESSTLKNKIRAVGGYVKPKPVQATISLFHAALIAAASGDSYQPDSDDETASHATSSSARTIVPVKVEDPGDFSRISRASSIYWDDILSSDFVDNDVRDLTFRYCSPPFSDSEYGDGVPRLISSDSRQPSPCYGVENINIRYGKKPGRDALEALDNIEKKFGLPQRQCPISLSSVPASGFELAHVIPQSTRQPVVSVLPRNFLSRYSCMCKRSSSSSSSPLI